MLGMFHQAAGRLGVFVVSSMLVVGVITSPAQQMVTDTRDPSQTQDEEFERLVKQWTTQPYFISPLVDHLPTVPGVPSPKDVFGYHVGAPAKLTYYADLLKYYRALATALPARVRVETIGKSDEERELVVVWVSSDENMRDLERNRSNLARLADPRGLTPEQIKALITSTKPHYHLMGGLHSGETGPSEMLVELVYRLATETSPLIKQIRENVVVSVTPVADPDGRDRNVDWFYRNLELFGPAPPAAATPSTPAPQTGQGASTAPPGVPYWGKYVHHDNNRDINLSQQSMRALAEWYFTAHPPIMHDLHESLPLLYTYSGGAPQNPNLDPILFAELPWFSNFELAQMTKWGMPGVYTHAFMDGWSPGYLGSIAYNHNGMMRMYETQAGREDGQGGGRGGEPGASGTATGIEQGRGGAATTTPTGRGGGQQREWYRGIPIPPGSQNTWSRRNNTNYMQTGVLSALQLTAAFPNLVIDNFYRKTANSIEAGKTEAPHGYVIPVQRDMTRVAELVNILRVQRIEVGRAHEPDQNHRRHVPRRLLRDQARPALRPPRQESPRKAKLPGSEPPHLRRQRMDDGAGDARRGQGDQGQSDPERGDNAGYDGGVTRPGQRQGHGRNCCRPFRLEQHDRLPLQAQRHGHESRRKGRSGRRMWTFPPARSS